MRGKVRLTVTSLVAASLLLSWMLGPRGVRAAPVPAPAALTHICGVLSSNTTLTLAGSPYEFDCPVTVANGVVLTVQPGVTVDAASTSLLTVNGILLANGSASSRITFTCTAVTCNARSWRGIQFARGASSASQLSFVDIVGASTALLDYPGSRLADDSFSSDSQDVTYDDSASLTLEQDTFRAFDSGFAGIGGTVALASDTFIAGNAGSLAASMRGGSLSVNGTSIQGVQLGLDVGSATLAVFGSVLSPGRPQSTAISVGRAGSLSLTGSTVENAQYGVSAVQSPLSITVFTSSLIQNTVALALDAESNSVHINNNNILSNTGNLDLSGGTPGAVVDASSNWWGTTDPAVIVRGIYDCRSDSTLPCVSFQPFLLAPPFPPPGLPAPTVTPTPTVTASPQPVAGLRLDPSSVAAGSGSGIFASGSGFAAGETIALIYTIVLIGGGSDQQQASTAAFANGTFLLALPPVPGDAVPGDYLVTAVGVSSHRAAAAILTILTPSATSTPTATPSPTPTFTPAPTSTATPTATPTVTLKKPLVLRFQYAYLWYGTVRAGTWDRLVVQASPAKRFEVTLDVIFPAGADRHFVTHTNRRGLWHKRFRVPRHTIGRYSNQALAIVELHHGLVTTRVTLPFKLVK